MVVVGERGLASPKMTAGIVLVLPVEYLLAISML